MEIALWIGLGFVVLFIIRTLIWLIEDFKKNNRT
jgi:hypothetical protein